SRQSIARAQGTGIRRECRDATAVRGRWPICSRFAVRGVSMWGEDATPAFPTAKRLQRSTGSQNHRPVSNVLTIRIQLLATATYMAAAACLMLLFPATLSPAFAS